MANPTLLTSPIAENGDKNVIPATTGASTGLLDQEHGFQQINELPLQAGGLPPQRKDFNGAFNLLSKILFYAQKGYVFEYDENQDYYAGCITKDTDGGLYCVNTDVSPSSTHPKDDPTNWSLVNYGINKKETFTSSGSFTAPVTGTYRITLKGAGGGGAGAAKANNISYTGSGGAEGGCLVFYVKLTAGTSYAYTIGAGGAGGTGNASSITASSIRGSAGGDSSITIGTDVYTATGGNGGDYTPNEGMGGDSGGVGKINGVAVTGSRGATGQTGCSFPANSTVSGVAGACGAGGGGGYRNSNVPGNDGGGGCGGMVYSSPQTYSDGSAGGNGYIQFEYCEM